MYHSPKPASSPHLWTSYTLPHMPLNSKFECSESPGSFLREKLTWVKYMWSAECKRDLVPTAWAELTQVRRFISFSSTICTRSFQWNTRLVLDLCRTGREWPGERRPPAPVTLALPSSGVNSIASYTDWGALNFIPRTRESPRWVYSSKIKWLGFGLGKNHSGFNVKDEKRQAHHVGGESEECLT